MGVTGKLTPQAVEFEEAVLGALMIDEDAVTAVLDVLSPKMFYVEAHQHIFSAINKLFGMAEPIDLLTVTNQLRKDKLLDLVGGASYLAMLTNRVTSSANIEYHARIVMEKFVVRELIQNCNSIIADSFDESADVLQLLDQLIRTSNEGAKDIEYLPTGDQRVYHVVGRKINELGKEFVGQCGFSGVGGVMGCTHSDEAAEIRAMLDTTFFLIPGYGAQGGKAEDIAKYLKDGNGGVVVSCTGMPNTVRTYMDPK